MDAELQHRLKALPQVNDLLEQPELRELSAEFSHELIKTCCQQALARVRQDLLAGADILPAVGDWVQLVKAQLNDLLKPQLIKVINATGILLHTGLGRAPLSDEVYQRAFDRARQSCDLELNLENGKRGDRQEKLRDLLQVLTGAPDCAVANNNAAAVLLALNTLSHRRETIVSRGQLIEIGGSFRLPDVLRKSGAKLVEVGTTNRTYLQDYEEAINPKTGAILLAHTSNYRVKGFVQEVNPVELAALCRKHHLPLIHDLGGGVLIDLKTWGLPEEPLASASIAAGCSVVTFSGDKILGGPQAGILIGEKEVLRRIRQNPLMRALRPDKFTLSLLEETLKLYLHPCQLLEHHPVLARLVEDQQTALVRAQVLLERLRQAVISSDTRLEVVLSKAQLGSGALPLEEFPSAALRWRDKHRSAQQLAERLRQAHPPIIGYVRKESLYLDVKAVLDDEIEPFLQSLSEVMTSPPRPH